MSKSNRKAALERKIELLLGEREQRCEEINRIVLSLASLPNVQSRVAEIDKLVQACERVLQSDHPDWTREHIKPARPFVHKIPVRLGSCTRTALDILRTATAPMRTRDIAIEILRREGDASPDSQTITKVANTVGNCLKKKLERGFVATDGAWPGSWWAVREGTS